MVVKKTAKLGQLTGVSVNIQIEGQHIEEVDRFVYLGGIITNEKHKSYQNAREEPIVQARKILD